MARGKMTLVLVLSLACLTLAEECELDNMICTCREKDDNIDPSNSIPLPIDCYDIRKMGQTSSGRYDIYPYIAGVSAKPLSVWCDMETDSGGWTVLQRREDGSVKFNKAWDDYKNGFGYIGAEFWLGNENIHIITNQREYDLQVELEDYDDNRFVHNYDHFRLTDDSKMYTLYTGTHTEDVCVNSLGMEPGMESGLMITDSQITAFSEHSSSVYHAIKARLNLQTGSWIAGAYNTDQWIQVNFGVPKLVTGVVMQGRYNGGNWVKEYKVQYGNDGQIWQYVMDVKEQNEMVFTGNTDQHTPVTSFFALPIKAIYIRIRPIAWQGAISMRFEILGCKGDFLAYHKDQAFSTIDKDNDKVADEKCAVTGGAWWYGASCEKSALNGPYLPGAGTTTRGLIWEDFDGQVYSIRRTEMKIRPVD